MRAWFLTAILLISPISAMANDSEAEIKLGGISLKKSDSISLDSEDLYISQDKVIVKYKFTNHANKDVTTLVSFPLPGIPYELGPYYQDVSYPDYSYLDFKTIIDGKEIKYDVKTTAQINGKDVTLLVERYGWPIDWTGLDDPSTSLFGHLSQQELEPIAKSGLIKRLFKDLPDYYPAWSAVTNITRQQVFPANKTISVEHSYKPITGGSVGGSLTKQFRMDDPDTAKYYRQKYCTDKNFLNALDKGNLQKNINYSESWIGYILKSGANWKGPIKNFHLTIDKGKQDSLVSFCMSGVKKTSPTKFEVTKTNFEPQSDLNILIVNWYKFEN